MTTYSLQVAPMTSPTRGTAATWGPAIYVVRAEDMHRCAPSCSTCRPHAPRRASSKRRRWPPPPRAA